MKRVVARNSVWLGQIPNGSLESHSRVFPASRPLRWFVIL